MLGAGSVAEARPGPLGDCPSNRPASLAAWQVARLFCGSVDKAGSVTGSRSVLYQLEEQGVLRRVTTPHELLAAVLPHALMQSRPGLPGPAWGVPDNERGSQQSGPEVQQLQVLAAASKLGAAAGGQLKVVLHRLSDIQNAVDVTIDGCTWQASGVGGSIT